MTALLRQQWNEARALKTAGPGGGYIPWRMRHQGPIKLNVPRPVVIDRVAIPDIRQVLHPDEQKKARELIELLEEGHVPLEPKTRELTGTFGLRVDQDARLLFYPGVDGAWHLMYAGHHDYDEAARRWVNPPDMQMVAAGIFPIPPRLWHITNDPYLEFGRQRNGGVVHLTDDRGIRFWNSTHTGDRKWVAEVDWDRDRPDQVLESSSAPHEWLSDYTRVRIKRIVPMRQALEETRRPKLAALDGIAQQAVDTGTLDTFKVIHNARFGHDELGSVCDALDLDGVTQAQVDRASRQIQADSQARLRAEGYPERFTVYRKGGTDRGVVSVSTRRLDTFQGQVPYLVNRDDILTYGEALQRGTFAEDEMQVLGSHLMPGS